ncbi:hypothetical protein GCM10010350_74910 [Streptomyces galilaeus]|nr:hypothetical protein GCM10010350_74910 [Streptomyces galilaeus]
MSGKPTPPPVDRRQFASDQWEEALSCARPPLFDRRRTLGSVAGVPDHHSSPVECGISLPRLLGVLRDPTRWGIVRIPSDGAERGWGQFSAPVAKSRHSCRPSAGRP